ncbi:hypothetical protein E8D34_03850 [Nocardioides sp. GY 10113]|uniref:hypothetical protein n=1 Tax=Nocardioides sp. GY 10113 TaxID=2569761 RepID=UPI0010A7FD78|nr:hypothetical protein [Nocardioides sp. GY 10113]TIC88803.1 hypothetical protein E8D34_03850 [Nocardioides sp. GY 10113]
MTNAAAPARPPLPLALAAALAGLQGAVMVLVAVLEVLGLSSDRLAMGASTAFFFAAYGVLLIAAAGGLWRGGVWARGPVLITQLIVLGVAWTLRDHVGVALGLAVVAGAALVGMLHPATIAALGGGAEPEGADQASDSRD